jgi:hypothetical protein
MTQYWIAHYVNGTAWFWEVEKIELWEICIFIWEGLRNAVVTSWRENLEPDKKAPCEFGYEGQWAASKSSFFCQ